LSTAINDIMLRYVDCWKININIDVVKGLENKYTKLIFSVCYSPGMPGLLLNLLEACILLLPLPLLLLLLLLLLL
jgi:hypothetical protein